MNPKKRNKCRQLNRDLRNARLALQSAVEDLHKTDHESKILRHEIESLEGELRALMASAAIDATGFGKRKGFPSAAVGVGKDTADLLLINNKIKERTSELSLKSGVQREQQKYVNQKERALNNVESRISRLGCR